MEAIIPAAATVIGGALGGRNRGGSVGPQNFFTPFTTSFGVDEEGNPIVADNATYNQYQFNPEAVAALRGSTANLPDYRNMLYGAHDEFRQALQDPYQSTLGQRDLLGGRTGNIYQQALGGYNRAGRELSRANRAMTPAFGDLAMGRGRVGNLLGATQSTYSDLLSNEDPFTSARVNPILRAMGQATSRVGRDLRNRNITGTNLYGNALGATANPYLAQAADQGALATMENLRARSGLVNDAAGLTGLGLNIGQQQAGLGMNLGNLATQRGNLAGAGAGTLGNIAQLQAQGTRGMNQDLSALAGAQSQGVTDLFRNLSSTDEAQRAAAAYELELGLNAMRARWGLQGNMSAAAVAQSRTDQQGTSDFLNMLGRAADTIGQNWPSSSSPLTTAGGGYSWQNPPPMWRSLEGGV